MAKLYALEEALDKTNDLLIDKVLKFAKTEKEESPLSLTASLIKQRSELKKEIEEKLGTDEEEEKPEEASDDTPKEEDPDEESKKEEGEKDDTPTEEKSGSDDASDSGSQDELSEASGSKESLDGLIGSGLKDKETKEPKKEAAKPTEKKEATESFSYRKDINNIFKPITDRYTKYLVSLESFNVPMRLALEEQPIVYVKDSVIESLNNLIATAEKYIKHNDDFIKKTSVGASKLNEAVTVYKQQVANKKYRFTDKLVDSKDLLANLSIPDKSDLKVTSKTLLDYVTSSSKAINLVLNNEFSSLKDAYITSGFTVEGNDLAYTKVLPGFNLIKVHLENYQNYLRTKVQDFQYYTLKVLKTEDLYSLTAIDISSESDLDFILENIDKLFVSIGLYVDNLQTVTTNFRHFIDEIKIIIYNVEKESGNDLTAIGIDEKVQDFIKFKLVIETCYINTNIAMDYVTATLSVLGICIELKT